MRFPLQGVVSLETLTFLWTTRHSLTLGLARYNREHRLTRRVRFAALQIGLMAKQLLRLYPFHFSLFSSFHFQASGFEIYFTFCFLGEAFLMRRTVCLILPIKKFSSRDDSVSTVSRSGMMMSDNTSPKLCILFICTRLLDS